MRAEYSIKVSCEEISWNDVELKLAILQVLIAARRAKPKDGGVTLSSLRSILIYSEEREITDALDWLKGQGFVEFGAHQYLITVFGVDFLCEQLPLPNPPREEVRQNLRSGWWPPPPNNPTDTSGVPRRPRPTRGAGEIALPLPTPPTDV